MLIQSNTIIASDKYDKARVRNNKLTIEYNNYKSKHGKVRMSTIMLWLIYISKMILHNEI